MIAGLLIAASLMIGSVALAQTTCTTDADCSDGDACNGIEVCNLGTCEPGTPVVCTALDQCHVAGVCDPATGICSDPAAVDGTACDDADACTQTDTCQAGVCTGANPVVCTASDQCHVAGTCDPATGTCSNPAATDGTTCDDGSLCTTADSCQAGVCTGTGVVCTASDQCHAVGTCNPATGTCSNPALADGTACNDGLFCNVGETCTAGVCGGGFPRDCSSLTDPCNTGVCNEAAGSCLAQPTNEGLACDDGNTCTSGDVCTAGVCGGTPVVDCAGSRIVVANNRDGSVSVIRASDLVVEATAATGVAPQGVVVSPDGLTAYLTDTAADTVTAFDLLSHAPVATIGVDAAPKGIAITPDGQFVYVANSASDTISVIATASNTLVGSIALDPLGTLPPFTPTDLEVTPNGAFLYVSNTGHNTVSVFRTTDEFLLAEVPVGHQPGGVAITPNGALVFVANAADSTVSVLRVADNAVIGTVPVGRGPYDIAFASGGTLAFVTNSLASSVSKIRVSTLSVVDVIAVPSTPTGIAATPAGDLLYVASTGTNQVTVIDPQLNVVAPAVTVGVAPVGLAVTGVTKFQIAGAAVPSTVAPGGQVTFTFSYGNTGSKNATGVTLVATLSPSADFVSASPGGTLTGTTVTWPIGTLAAGASGVVSFTVAVHSPLAPNTQITSTATISDPEGVTAQASATSRVVSNPQYSLAKVDTPDPVAAGGTLTYTISYANNASANADGEGVLIAETYDRNFTFVSAVPAPIPGTNNLWAVGALPVGGSGTIVVTGTVKAPLPNGTILANVVTLRDRFGTALTAQQNTAVASSPVLGVALADAPDPAPAGGQVTYTINYANTGNNNAAGVVLITAYDPNVTFVSATPPPDAGTTDRWTIGALPTGGSGVIAVRVQLAPVLPNGSILTTQATLSDDSGDVATAAAATTVASAPVLSLSLTDAPDPIATGQTLTYTLTYANTGSDVAAGTRIVVAYDPGVTFVTADTPPSVGTNEWDVGDVPVGGGGTIVIQVQVNAPLGSILTTQAVISETGGTSATATANTTVQITPVLTLSLTDAPDPVPAGGLLTYTIRYGDTGNAPATTAVVSAVYDPNVTFVTATPAPDAGTTDQWTLGTLPDGTSGEIQVTVQVAAPLANGTLLTSQALLTADGGLTASASQSTTVQSAPALAITKTDDVDPVAPGGTVTYTITYTNSGTDTDAGVVVTEAYDPSVHFVSAVPPPDAGTINRWTIGTLAGGASGTIQVTGTAPAAPNGTLLTNTVTVRDAAGRSAVAVESTTVSSPTFSLGVTDSVDPVTSGQPLQFQVTYGNISGASQSGVVVRAGYDPNFVITASVPAPDAGTTDTWTIGTLASGATGQIVVSGFFGSTASARVAQTRFQISNPNGAAFATETTHVLASPPVAVGRLMLRRTGNDIWSLKGRFTAPHLDPTGLPLAISIQGPGGVEHITPLLLPQLQVVQPGYFSFFGNVQGNGLVKLFLKQRKAGDWFILVRSRGAGILPSFPADPTFFTVVRVGTASFVSTSGKLRDVGHRGLVREFP